MSRTRVVFLCANFLPDVCGVGDYTSLLARELSKDHDVLVIARGRRAARDTFPFAVYRPHHTLRRWTWPLWLRAIRRFQPDVIHTQWELHAFRMTGLVPFLCRAAGRRAVRIVTAHEFDATFGNRERSALAAHQWCVVNERGVGDRIARDNPHLALVKAFVPANIVPDPHDGRTPWDFRVFVQFGFLKRGRGLERAIDFVAWLNATGEGSRLWVIGPFDPARVAYHAEIQQLACSRGGYVDFLGALPPREVSVRLQEADVGLSLLVQSEKSGTLAAMIEHGLPVVVLGYSGETVSASTIVADDSSNESIDAASRRAMTVPRCLSQESRWAALADLHRELYGRALSARSERWSESGGLARSRLNEKE